MMGEEENERVKENSKKKNWLRIGNNNNSNWEEGIRRSVPQTVELQEVWNSIKWEGLRQSSRGSYRRDIRPNRLGRQWNRGMAERKCKCSRQVKNYCVGVDSSRTKSRIQTRDKGKRLVNIP